MLTTFIWYTSEIELKRSMIKLQFNFVEKLYYGFDNKELSSLAPNDDGLKYIFENHPYFEKINFSVYRPKEILCEKIRAILTRKAIKTKDFLDIYLICKAFGITLQEIKEDAIEKIQFALDTNQKYRDNLKENVPLIQQGGMCDWKEGRQLLLRDIDEDKLNFFVDRLEEFLRKDVLCLADDSLLCEIIVVCSNCLQKSFIPNPNKSRFDQINPISEKCPKCGKTDGLEALPT